MSNLVCNSYGLKEIIADLINEGTDTNISDIYGNTALIYGKISFLLI